MEKMWAGRTEGALSREADDFNSSIHFDSRMYRQDITGSMSHATMLAACKIISESDRDAIIDGLQTILDDIDSGALPIDPNAEDIHMFVEAELTKRIGDTGKRLHTAIEIVHPILVTSESYHREVCLNHTRLDIDYSKRSIYKVNAQAIRQGLHGSLCCAIYASARICRIP